MRWTDVGKTISLTGALVVGQATSSLAEVCDKLVGVSWRAEHGAVWLLNPVLGEKSAIVTIIAALVLLGLLVSRRLGYVAAAVFLALVVWEGLAIDWTTFGQAVDEGCLSTPTQGLGAAVLLLLACGSILWRRTMPDTPARHTTALGDGDRHV